MNQRSVALTRRDRLRDERRRRILAAAESVFGSLGYHDASLADIARRAGLAVGTVYLYFDDKSDLYGHVLLEKMQTMVARFEATLQAGLSPAACLRAAVHAQFAFHDANRRFFEIFLVQSQMQSSPLHAGHWRAMESHKRRILDLIEACIVRGQAAGEFLPGNARLFATAYLGMTLQMIRQWIRERHRTPLARSADFAADCFLFGAAAAGRRRPRTP